MNRHRTAVEDRQQSQKQGCMLYNCYLSPCLLLQSIFTAREMETTSNGNLNARLQLFVYRGQRRSEIPRSLTRILVDAENFKSIHEGAFFNCQQLQSVELNHGLDTIGKSSFHGCCSLTYISIPPTVREICKSAFQRCTGLVKVKLQEGLQMIDEWGFYKCMSLEKIYLPSTLREIGAGAFAECENLTFVELLSNASSSTTTTSINNGGLQTIGQGAFECCSSLRKIVFRSSVRRIGRNIFRDCSSLRIVHLPDGLQDIGNYAFANCESLQRIKIPSTTFTIRPCAFLSCRNLISVEISTAEVLLHSVDESIFASCPLLMNVEAIPSLTNVMDDSSSSTHLSRFNQLPVHQLCYNQVFDSTASTLEKLRNCIPLVPLLQGDKFGMTPFHILALSTRPSLFLFFELMTTYPANAIYQKDDSDKTPLEYLCMNDDSTNDSVAIIKHLFQLTFVEHLKWLGLEQWRREILNKIDNFPFRSEDGIEKLSQLKDIEMTFSLYNRLECISLLEQIVWKQKITNGTNTSIRSISESDRQCCRINCGADIVISNVLPFLGGNS